MVKALKIRSTRKAGFRRAGYRFSVEPTVISVADLSEEQIAALKAEPNLLVEEVDLDAGEAPEKKPGKGGKSKQKG